METFVIQIPAQDGAQPAEPRGVVEHVGSGRREPFRDANELLAFLRSQQRGESQEVDR